MEREVLGGFVIRLAESAICIRETDGVFEMAMPHEITEPSNPVYTCAEVFPAEVMKISYWSRNCW